MWPDQCITDTDLHRYHAGEMDELDGKALASHIEQCPQCAHRNSLLLTKHRDIHRLLHDLGQSRFPSAGSPRRTAESAQAQWAAGVETTPWFPVIPGYQLLRKVHKGGQGIIFEATRCDSHQRVAIKLLKEGVFAGEQEEARFEREIQVLATLRHPGIVTIHDSGITGGCYWFAMDFVEGEPLDVFLKQRSLSTSQKLDLFVRICSAVNSAHLLGIIHRDLKPGNVVITGDGEPHVLDFGLAKLTSARSTPARATVTGTGQFLGSLFWTSPEQAEGRHACVDVRTDVYSLGVLLYQALTGEFPYPVKGTLREVLDNICERPAPHPAEVAGDLDDEIDTIVLKCLNKEPGARYQNAGEIARDLTRYLNNEPIEAKADSGLYVLRKILSRHKTVTCFSILMLLSLAAFAVSVSIQSIRLSQARNTAVAAQRAAEDALERARHEAARADEEAERFQRLAYIGEIAVAQKLLGQSSVGPMQQVLANTDPARRGWEWERLLWLADRSFRTIHTGPVPQSLLHTRSGDLLWGTADGILHRWDMTCQRFVYQTKVLNSIVSLALGNDDRNLYVAGTKGKVVVDAQTGTVISTIDDVGATAMRLTPDQRTLVSILNNTLTMIDLRSRRKSVHVASAAARESALALSPDGRHIAVASHDCAVLYDMSGKQLSLLKDDEHGVQAVCFSPDGKLLAMSGGLSAIQIWDVERREVVQRLSGDAEQISCLAYSNDGRRLISGHEGGSVQLWDIRSDELLKHFNGHKGPVRSVSFSSDPQFVVSSDRNGTIRWWKPADITTDATWKPADWAYCSAAWSPDQKQIAATENRHVSIWDAERPAAQPSWTTPATSVEITDTGFSPDGKRLLVADVNGLVTIWDVASHALVGNVSHPKRVAAARYSPDGRALVTASLDHTCRVWDASDLKLKSELPHTGEVWALAISHSSRLLAAGVSDGSVRLWDLTTGSLVRDFEPLPLGVDAIAFSPDDRKVATGDIRGNLVIRDVESGAMPVRARSMHDIVYAATFTADGRRVVVGTRMFIEVFDANSGELVFSFRAHDRPIHSLEFSTDGKTLLSGGRDGRFKLWPAANTSD